MLLPFSDLLMHIISGKEANYKSRLENELSKLTSEASFPKNIAMKVMFSVFSCVLFPISKVQSL